MSDTTVEAVQVRLIEALRARDEAKRAEWEKAYQ
jgi:hypothetical protein